MLQEVQQRIDVRGGDVRVSISIAGRVERDRRVAAFTPAERVVVIERVDAGVAYVGVVREVATTAAIRGKRRLGR